MKKVKLKYKIIMIDGYVQKISAFTGEGDFDNISNVRSWMNENHPFVSVGNNNILNLRYVKRIKRIWRLRDHLPSVTFMQALVFFILFLMITGYLIMIGIK